MTLVLDEAGEGWSGIVIFMKVVEVRGTDNIVCNRPPHKRVLTDKTHNWKNDVKTVLSLHN